VDAGSKGSVDIAADSITGVVNVTAGTANVGARGAALNLGTMNISGDPTFWSTGDISIPGVLNAFDSKIAYLAGGNIIINDGATIQSRSAQPQGNDITIVAGANLVSTAVQFPTQIGSGTTVTVKGPGAGGNITCPGCLAGFDITSSSTSGNLNGGNIFLAAYRN